MYVLTVCMSRPWEKMHYSGLRTYVCLVTCQDRQKVIIEVFKEHDKFVQEEKSVQYKTLTLDE